MDFIKTEKFMDMEECDYKTLINIIDSDLEFFKKHAIIDYSLLVGYHIIDSNTTEHAIHTCNNKNNIFLSRDRDKFYFCGIIDILTPFNWFKKGEWVSRTIYCGSGISCVPFNQYANRFIKFIANIAKSPDLKEDQNGKVIEEIKLKEI